MHPEESSNHLPLRLRGYPELVRSTMTPDSYVNFCIKEVDLACERFFEEQERKYKEALANKGSQKGQKV